MAGAPGRRWLLWLTACALCSPSAGLMCTFEDDSCSWTWNETLQMVSGRDANRMVRRHPHGHMTAALVDADGNEDGHYLLLTSLAGGTHAQLTSPWYAESGENCRIEMAIHFFNADFVEIIVVIKKKSSDKPVYLSVDGSDVNTWKTYTDKIGKIREEFRLIIEVKLRGEQLPNHVGIDNIKLDDCLRETPPTERPCDASEFKCDNNVCISLEWVCDLQKDCLHGEDEMQKCELTPPGTPCDFESGQCGWRNGDAFLEWKHHSGPAADVKTAPSSDHTFGNDSGHFMLLDDKAGNFSSFGLLRSPLFPPTPKYNSDRDSPFYQSCKFRFFIHMYGPHVGEASLYIQDEINGKTRIWRLFGEQSNAWRRIVVPLPPRYNISYHLEFHGVKSYGSSGSIGLDDLSLSRECFGNGVPKKHHPHYNFSVTNPGTKHPAVYLPKQTVFSFSTCKTTGHLGPQQRACDLAYRKNTSHVTVLGDRYYKGVQRWLVPASGVYSIVASGASGGNGFDSFDPLSRASTAVSVVHLNKGEEVFMVVGQEGTDACKKTARERCRRNTPQSFPDVSRLQGIGRHHRRPRGILDLRNFPFVGGGGGGGGGTFVFKVADGQRRVPLVVAGGGGGRSNNKNNLVSPHGQGENRTVGHGNGRASDPRGAGAGGGWNDSKPVSAGGFPLVLGAAGGAPCQNASSRHTFGGFGGGGGGCSAGGGGGGYAGGDAFSGKYRNGRGGLSFTSGQHRSVRAGSHLGPGEVHIIPAFKGCNCEHRCVAIDEQMTITRCICPDGWQLMDDNISCRAPPEHSRLQRWSNTVLIVLVVLATVFLVVVGSMAGCYYNMYQRKKVLRWRREVAGGGLPLNPLRRSAGDILTEYNPNYEFHGTLPCTVKDLRKIPRQNLTLVKELGKGAFGQVYQGYLKNYVSDSVEMPCAVKTLTELSSEQAEMDFLMEAMIMSKFVHPNIVHFIGVSFEQHPRFIVLELLSGGDLKSFLRESRPTPERPPNLKVYDLLTCAIDVAKGCEYLENKRFIHRDIAARNCLLTTKGPGRVVKIADFGMSRDIYRADYYRKGGRTMIPVKWMPPEAFLDGVFTTKTDVWSFGVLLWEVMTLGQLPYPGRGNTEVMQLVMDGGRLDAPPNCPPPVYGVMCQCWQRVPEERPSFTTVLERLDYCLQDPDVMAAPLPVFDRLSSTDKDMTVMRPSDSEPLLPLDAQKRTRSVDTPASSSSADYLVPTQPSSHSLSTVRTELASEPSWEDVHTVPSDDRLVSETSFGAPERRRSGGAGAPLLPTPDAPPDRPPPVDARRKPHWSRKPSPLNLDPGGLPPAASGAAVPAAAGRQPAYMNVGAEGALAASAMPRTSSYDKALGRTEPCIIGITTPKADAEKNHNYSEIHC